VWHILLPRLDPKLLYGYRIRGPNQDKSKGADGEHDLVAVGHRCDEVGVGVGVGLGLGLGLGVVGRGRGVHGVLAGG